MQVKLEIKGITMIVNSLENAQKIVNLLTECATKVDTIYSYEYAEMNGGDYYLYYKEDNQEFKISNMTTKVYRNSEEARDQKETFKKLRELQKQEEAARAEIPTEIPTEL